MRPFLVISLVLIFIHMKNSHKKTKLTVLPNDWWLFLCRRSIK